MKDPIWKREITLPLIAERANNTLMSHLDIEFVDIGPDYLSAQMPITDQVKQPVGIMHGGASCALAESVGSMAASFCIDITTHYCVGLSLYINHIGSTTSGIVVATAKPSHLGRGTQIWQIETRQQETNKLIAQTQLTMAVLERNQA